MDTTAAKADKCDVEHQLCVSSHVSIWLIKTR